MSGGTGGEPSPNRGDSTRPKAGARAATTVAAENAGARPSREAQPPRAAQEPIGGPTQSSWREGALTRTAELEVLANWFARYPEESRDVLVSQIHRHVKTARTAAEGEPGRGAWFRFSALLAGSPHERTASNIDAAEADLLRLAPDEYVSGQMPSLVAQVRAHLPADDPRRRALEELATAPGIRALNPVERNIVISAVRAANSEARREVMRVRSFATCSTSPRR